MSLPPRALARLKERYEIARECSQFNRGRASLPPRLEARLKKDTRFLSIAFFVAGLVAGVSDTELDRGLIGDLDCLQHGLAQ